MTEARYASLLAFAQSRGVVSRAFCPAGEGNGIDNSCGSGQSSQSFPKGSKPLRDAVDSVSPSPDKVWDRSKGLADTPSPKQMDEIANEQTGHSGKTLTPEAEASYGSLVDEIGRQYEALTAAGLKARAWRGEGEPYGDPPGSTKPNSNKMREEVAKTGEFSFFMTDKGFGTGDATPNHPMLRETKYKTADGEPMIANDLFRVVHDMVAHVRGGYSFSTNGEYNGMLTHASTLPESAWPALFAETFGQNAVYEKTKQYAPQNAYASKVGPGIIRSELKKRTKTSRSEKPDSDEPLGYQHIKSRPSLLAALRGEESRSDCARDDDGKFASGNKCANSDGDSRPSNGKLRHDDGTQTNVARKLYQMGVSEQKLGEFVRGLGGSPKATTVKFNAPNLNVSVKSSGGKALYHVDIGYYKVRVYPVSHKPTAEELGKIKELASSTFPKKPASGKTNSNVEVSVFSDPKDFQSWKAENAEKQKAIKDKYKYSPYLAPNEKPIEWKSDVTLQDLIEARNCGNGPGGFQPGNTCASGKVADAAKGAAKGALSGAAAAAGGLAPHLPYIAKGAAVGAAAGAIKGLYDNKMRPTRVMDKIKEVGSSENKISKLVKNLGGSPSSLADVSRGKLQLTVKDESGKKLFHVQIGKDDVVIYPRSASGTLSDKQIARVRQVAKESVPKHVSIEVKSSSKAYLARLVKNGFRIAANAAGSLVATAVLAPAADTVVGDALYSMKKKRR
jgi:hypothetical protein